MVKYSQHDFMQEAGKVLPQVSKDLVLESTFDDGGLLPPVDALQFIELLEAEADFRQYCTINAFTRQKMRFNTLDMEGTMLVPKVEATATSIRNVPIVSEKFLQPIRFIAPVELSSEALDVNLEEESFADHLMRLVAKGIQKDINRMILWGDTTGVLGQDKRYPGYAAADWMVDPFLKQMDGIMAKGVAAGNVIDFGDYAQNWFGPNVCTAMVLDIPEERKESYQNMKFFVSVDSFYDYINTLVKTGKDNPAVQQYLEGSASPKYRGINPIIPINAFSRNPKQVVVDSVEAGGTIQLDWYPVLANSLKVVPNSIGSTFTTPYAESGNYTFNETTGLWVHTSGGAIPTGTDLNLTYNAPPFALMTDSTNTQLGISTDDMKMKMREDIEKDTIYIVIHTRLAIEVIDLEKIRIGSNLSNRDYGLWTED